MALSSLTFYETVALVWTALKTVTGLPGGNQNAQQPSSTFALGTAAANAAVGGSDELYFAVLSIAGSGTQTLDLTSLSDVLSASFSFARLKFLRFKLLGSGEFAPDGLTAGTACSSVTIGGAGSNANLMFMNSSTPTFVLNGGVAGEAITWESPTAAGKVVDSSHKNILVTNNDSGNTAKIVVYFVGGTS